MITLRRCTAVLSLAALAALAAFALASCAKNDLMGQGLELWIGVKGVSPQGTGSGDAGWGVNVMDSVLFVQDVDSTTLEVTTFVERDSLGHQVQGTLRYMPSNVYMAYYQAYPSTAYYIVYGAGAATSAIGKLYFIPTVPRHPYATYTYSLTTGVRMQAGRFIRDTQSWGFTTGDSLIAPSVPARAS